MGVVEVIHLASLSLSNDIAGERSKKIRLAPYSSM
jgi:hypothetical protein